MAAPVSAQEWNLDWGGFMNSHLAYVDASGAVSNAFGAGADYDGVSTFLTGEIQFTPSVTLDNGITFGVNVQLEAQNNAAGGATNNIDESFIEISSDTFGKIIFGAENSAGYKSMTGAPIVTSMYINSPSFSAFIPASSAVPFNFRQAGISTWAEVAGNNDVNRITYFTPNFNGFVAGVSYARNNNGNANQGFFGGGIVNNNGVATIEDIFDLGASYRGTFGGVDVALTGRYGMGNGNIAGTADPTVWGIGGQLGYAGFTIGGSYGENNNGNGAYGVDQYGWSAGATYDMAGPWAFEAVTYQGTFDDVGGPGTSADGNYQAYRIGASRDIGPGVDFDVYAIYTTFDTDGTNALNLNATIIGTAINLSF
jgi:predicted porin